MTSSQITTLIGRTGLFTSKEGLKFSVIIRNSRACFGREDILIEPSNGSGEAWVGSNRVQIIEEIK